MYQFLTPFHQSNLLLCRFRHLKSGFLIDLWYHGNPLQYSVPGKMLQTEGSMGSPESDWTEGTERVPRTYTLLTTAVFLRGTWNNGECRKQCCIHDSVKQAQISLIIWRLSLPPCPPIPWQDANRCLINVDWNWKEHVFKFFYPWLHPSQAVWHKS